MAEYTWTDGQLVPKEGKVSAYEKMKQDRDRWKAKAHAMQQQVLALQGVTPVLGLVDGFSTYVYPTPDGNSPYSTWAESAKDKGE